MRIGSSLLSVINLLSPTLTYAFCIFFRSAATHKSIWPTNLKGLGTQELVANSAGFRRFCVPDYFILDSQRSGQIEEMNDGEFKRPAGFSESQAFARTCAACRSGSNQTSPRARTPY